MPTQPEAPTVTDPAAADPAEADPAEADLAESPEAPAPTLADPFPPGHEAAPLVLVSAASIEVPITHQPVNPIPPDTPEWLRIPLLIAAQPHYNPLHHQTPEGWPHGMDGRSRTKTAWDREQARYARMNVSTDSYRNKVRKYPPGQSPTRLDMSWTTAFLETFAETWNFSAACKAAGVSYRRASYTLQKDRRFAEQFAEALQAAKDKARAAFWEAGIEGRLEDVWYQGQVVGEKRVYDNNVADKILKAQEPEVWDGRVRAANAMGEILQAATVDRSRSLSEAESRLSSLLPPGVEVPVIDVEVVQPEAEDADADDDAADDDAADHDAVDED